MSKRDLAKAIVESAAGIAERFDDSKFPGQRLAVPLAFSPHPFFKSSAGYQAYVEAHETVQAHIELLEEWREKHAIPTE